MVVIAGQPRRRPLIGIALALVGGILTVALVDLPVGYIIVAGMLWILSATLMIRTGLSTAMVFISIAMIAALRFLVADASIAKNSINRNLAHLPWMDCEVIGRVCGPPKYYPFKTGEYGMWVFPLCVEGLHDSGQWVTQRGEIDVRVMGARKSEPSAVLGERIWVKGELQERNYRGGNPVGMKVAWPRHCRSLAPPGFSWTAWCRKWREAAGDRLDVGLGDKPLQLAVLRSLILGYRNEIPSDTYACFKRTGSLHIFAISGLHVGIIGLLLVIVLKSVGVPRDWFGVWLIPLLFLYVAATGMKASALRAMVMAAVFLMAPLFRRRPDVPTSVAFAGILLLLLNPHELHSAGFVYSFVVVAFIIMVYSVIPERWMTGGWVRRYGLSLVITSCAACVASIPMTAFYFGRFSPVALIGNLAVVPLTFCIVLSGWLSILIPPASIVFNYASVVFINAMLWCVQSLDRLPGSSFLIEKPPAAAILLWYASLIYLLVHATRPRQRIFAMGGACAALLVAVFV